MLFYIMYYIIALQVAFAQNGDAANYSTRLDIKPFSVNERSSGYFLFSGKSTKVFHVLFMNVNASTGVFDF